MFTTHNINNNNNLSIKNLILLFLTIVLGFASVITLAQLTIPSSIDNAHQTIGRVTITSDGTANGTTFRDFNDAGNGKTYVTGLIDQGNFSGRILGVDENGYLVYAYSTNLVISGSTGGGGGGDSHWTGDIATDIRNRNIGKVGIGTNPTTGKLQITSTAETELVLQELETGKAANIHFINPLRTRTIGGDSNPDLFYIGKPGTANIVILGTSGYVGIGTTEPKATTQIVGNLIVGSHLNNIIGSQEQYSTVLGGRMNVIDGQYSFIGGGSNNIISGSYTSFIGGGYNNILSGGSKNFIGGGEFNSIYHEGQHNFIGGGNKNIIATGNTNIIGGGEENKILNGEYNTIGGGKLNKIFSESTETKSKYNTIIGGQINIIQEAENSTIIGGFNNGIKSNNNSIVGGTNALSLHDNSFVWNSNNDPNNPFFTNKEKTFIINALNGVGIRTNNPQGDLHIAGKGVLVLSPQNINPQSTSGRISCSITGSIVFKNTTKKPCYCDGIEWKSFSDNGPCQ